MGLSGALQQQRATRTDSESEVVRLTRRGRQPNQVIGERGIDLYRAYLSLYVLYVVTRKHRLHIVDRMREPLYA